MAFSSSNQHRYRGGVCVVLLFFLAPLLLVLTGERLRPVPVHLLLLWLAGFLVWLWLRKHVPQNRLWGSPPPGWWRGPLFRAGIFGLAAVGYTLACEPDTAFSFVRARPGFWLLVMILYPLLSVLPQELIYRVFLLKILERPSRPDGWLPITASALLFSWAHVIYAGYTALFSTFLAGLILGCCYYRQQGKPGAIWAILLEHSLYGQIDFTTGLGHYFYLLRGG